MLQNLQAEAQRLEYGHAFTRPSRRGTDENQGYFLTAQNMTRSIVAHALMKPGTERQRVLDALTLEAGYGLGRNPSNLIQMTTASTPLAVHRSVQEIYTSGGYDGVPGMHPGHTPYLNPHDWGTMTMARPSWLWSKSYPSEDILNRWPRAELHFNTRWTWAHAEFTPQQTMRGKQALYAYLHAIHTPKGTPRVP
jgi:hypothetical protein